MVFLSLLAFLSFLDFFFLCRDDDEDEEDDDDEVPSSVIASTAEFPGKADEDKDEAAEGAAVADSFFLHHSLFAFVSRPQHTDPEDLSEVNVHLPILRATFVADSLRIKAPLGPHCQWQPS